MEKKSEAYREFHRMKQNVSRCVNSLELCWSCERICECEQWLANEAVPVWLCMECLSEVSYRLAKQTAAPLALLPA